MSRKRKSNPDRRSDDETIRNQVPSEVASPKKSMINPLPPDFEELDFPSRMLLISQIGHDALRVHGEKNSGRVGISPREPALAGRVARRSPAVESRSRIRRRNRSESRTFRRG